MRKWTILLGVLALSGCGGATDARVRKHVPDARDIRCVKVDPSTTRCEAHVGNALVGEQTWTCEFTYERGPGRGTYAGSESCWSSWH
jgi:hypothetical protein